ncbi:MAG TPA: tetratricopeptide repeat protein [Bryobacteraceae bacterium]|nr:tetratricopeptide repeat protein [Bryobacteraceae bacterium]
MRASRLLLLGVALAPAILLGQKKEELVSIQRDVAQLEDNVKQLQKSLDEKMAALTALMQQALEVSNRNAATLATMQKEVDQKLADQQTKLVAPVASLGLKVDDMSGDFSKVRENVAELVRKFNDLDAKVTDISQTVRTLAAQQTVAPPPAAAGTSGETTAGQTPSGPPAGMSVELSFQTAYSDYMGKKDNLALDEFAKYIQYFPTSAHAPEAQYYVGQIYYRAEAYEDAAKAFDAVLEKFPKNPKTSESQYMKACSLMNAKHKTAAATEFKSFLANYPDSPHVREAHKHLRELGYEPTPAKRGK